MFREIILTAMLIFINMAYAFSQPKIEIVGSSTFDWKRVSIKEEQLMTSFSIKNAGNQKLIINEIKPACGCTTADVDKKELEPGEVVAMPVIFSIKGTHGRISKTITIKSNDPVVKEKILFLVATVFNPIEIIPGFMLGFDDMKIGTESETKFIIINNTPKPVTFSDFRSEPADLVSISVKGDLVLSPGEEIELTVRATPVLSGEFNSSINFKTDNKEYPEFTIKCFGKVKE